MNKYKYIIALFLLVVIGFFAYKYIKNYKNEPAEMYPDQRSSDAPNTSELNLETKINQENGLIIEATPKNFKPSQQVQFEIALTTHQGDLDFDLTKQAILIDDGNRQYLPFSWDGGNGGHHLSGTLIFPAIPENTGQIKLVIRDVYGGKERQFLWELK